MYIYRLQGAEKVTCQKSIASMLSLFSCIAHLSVKYKGTNNAFSTSSKPLPISLALAFTKLSRHFPQTSVIRLEAEMK